MNKKIIVLIVLISLGCNDIFNEEEKHIIGNISLINPHNEEDQGFKMVLNERGFNSNILEDYINDIQWNDSLILVKGQNKATCDQAFYIVTHNQGKRPLRIDTLTAQEYFQTGTRIKFDNMVQDLTDKCR